MLLWLLACAPERPPNILLVSMDTVRWDRTSLGGARDTTPNLAALAARGVSFDQAFAVGNESLYSHAAIFTGRYPSEVADPDYATFAVPEGATTLAGVLGAYGYDTAAFTGGGHLLAAFGFDEGFDTFSAVAGDTSFGSLFDSVPSALGWIRARPADRPWFAFVHGYDAHAPYVQRGPFRHLYGADGATPTIERIVASPTEVERVRGDTWFPDRELTDFVHAAGRTILGTDFYTLPATPRPGERAVKLTPAEIAHLRDHYDTGLTYGDLWLGALLEGIDLDDTLVIVLGDHGEDLLDHGNVNHRSGLWDSTLHVPLVVAGPGFGAGERRDALVDLRDVLPTALRAAGATLPAGVGGAPLQDAPGRDAVYAEGVMDMMSVRTRTRRLVVRDARAGDLAARGPATLSLYAVPEDGDRLATGAPDAMAEAEPLLTRLAAWRAGLSPAAASGREIPAPTRDALREQGYWTPGQPERADPPAP